MTYCITIRITKKLLMKISRRDFSIHTDFLNTILRSSFYFSKEMFTCMNIYVDDWEKFDETPLLEKEDFKHV